MLRGYHRRRGWLAWHVAKLGRIEPRDFPDLADMTGEVGAAEIPEQTPQQMAHSVRMWRAMLKVKRPA